jgi:hypothetical protein
MLSILFIFGEKSILPRLILPARWTLNRQPTGSRRAALQKDAFYGHTGGT